MSSRSFSLKSAYACSIGTAVVITANFLSARSFQPVFEPFGRDLPTITLLLMDSYKFWVLVPALSVACLAYAHRQASMTAYKALQILLFISVLTIPFTFFGVYAPVVSG